MYFIEYFKYCYKNNSKNSLKSWVLFMQNLIFVANFSSANKALYNLTHFCLFMIFRFLKILIFRIILPIQTKSVCLSVLTQFQFAFWIFLPLETFTYNCKTHWQAHTCVCIYVYASIYNKSNSILTLTHKH